MDTSVASKIRLLLLAAAAALLAIGIWSFAGKPAPPSAPADAVVSGANETRLYGSAQCGACHDEQFRDYSSSGHAQTLWSTHDFPFRDRFEGLTFSDPERQDTYHYSLSESGLDVAVPGRFGGERFPLQFAFGSGQHAITFVSLTPDGSSVPAGIEHRVSWFTGLDQADLTPGQLGRPVRQQIECFGRVIRGEALERCFECHTTSGRIEGDQVVDFVPNVGCESCHSGGAAHAAAMHDGSFIGAAAGFTRQPWRTTDQIQICARCHRGEDAVAKTDITRQNSKLVRFQPVGLVQSKCYLQSAGQLTCTTCHNPHQHASLRTTAEYERQCLQCHSASADSVACSVSPDHNCVSCHMPRIEIHPSISFHDHWIRIRTDTDPPAVGSDTDDSH